jgi:hypothetical protein
MDICTLAPCERETLLLLIHKYNLARERVIAFLKIIGSQWEEETIDWKLEFDDAGEEERVLYRLNKVMDWIELLDEKEIHLIELDKDSEC